MLLLRDITTTCYRFLTRVKDTISLDTTNGEQDEAEKHSYEKLFSYIQTELFLNPEVLPITVLTTKFVACMKSLGISEVKKHLRRSLESEIAAALLTSFLTAKENSLFIPGADLGGLNTVHSSPPFVSLLRCKSWLYITYRHLQCTVMLHQYIIVALPVLLSILFAKLLALQPHHLP